MFDSFAEEFADRNCSLRDVAMSDAFATFRAQAFWDVVSVLVLLCSTMYTTSCSAENVRGARRNAITKLSRTTVILGENTFAIAELKLCTVCV
jgi:hypothetical protein